MKITDNAAGDALLNLSASQREKLADLLEAERKHATRWWTFLNEMRCRGELPEWVFKQLVGSCVDHDRCNADQEALNRALFGKKKYIRFEGEAVFKSVYFSDIQKANRVEHRV